MRADTRLLIGAAATSRRRWPPSRCRSVRVSSDRQVPRGCHGTSRTKSRKVIIRDQHAGRHDFARSTEFNHFTRQGRTGPTNFRTNRTRCSAREWRRAATRHEGLGPHRQRDAGQPISDRIHFRQGRIFQIQLCFRRYQSSCARFNFGNKWCFVAEHGT